MSDYIPVKKLSVQDQERIYKKLMAQPNKPIPGNIRNPEDYIFLEAKQHGSYSYPDLLVSMHRLGLDFEVGKAANKLNLKVSNTAKEQDGHLYIGNLQHEQAIKLVIESGYIPLNLRLFVDFLKEIKYGLEGKKKVYGGNKNIISYDRLLTAWNEITEKRDFFRAEWFDNRFVKEGNQLHNISSKINPNRNLELVKEPLEECLMEDKFLGIGLIGLEDWLERASKQGLPPNDVKSGNLNYWYPKNGAVAGFGAYSVWVGLDCNGSPLGSDPGLGIRLAKLKE